MVGNDLLINVDSVEIRDARFYIHVDGASLTALRYENPSGSSEIYVFIDPYYRKVCFNTSSVFRMLEITESVRGSLLSTHLHLASVLHPTHASPSLPELPVPHLLTSAPPLDLPEGDNDFLLPPGEHSSPLIPIDAAPIHASTALRLRLLDLSSKTYSPSTRPVPAASTHTPPRAVPPPSYRPIATPQSLLSHGLPSYGYYPSYHASMTTTPAQSGSQITSSPLAVPQGPPLSHGPSPYSYYPPYHTPMTLPREIDPHALPQQLTTAAPSQQALATKLEPAMLDDEAKGCNELDLLRVCLIFVAEGSRSVLLSRVGIEMNQRYPNYRKGVLTRLVDSAVKSGWAKREGTLGSSSIVIDLPKMSEVLLLRLRAQSTTSGASHYHVSPTITSVAPDEASVAPYSAAPPAFSSGPPTRPDLSTSHDTTDMPVGIGRDELSVALSSDLSESYAAYTFADANFQSAISNSETPIKPQLRHDYPDVK